MNNLFGEKDILLKFIYIFTGISMLIYLIYIYNIK